MADLPKTMKALVAYEITNLRHAAEEEGIILTAGYGP